MKKISLPFNFKSSNLKTSQLSQEEKAKITRGSEGFASTLSQNEKKSPLDESSKPGDLQKTQESQVQKNQNLGENQQDIPKTLSREEQLILSAKQISPGGNPKLFGK